MASYQQEESRLWSVRFRFIEDGVEKQKRLRGFKTKKDAQQAYTSFMSSHINIKDKASEITFKQLACEFIEHTKKRVKESSYLDTKRKVETRILPYFEKCYVTEITPLTITKWQNQLIDEKYSYKYRKDLRNYLSRILKFGATYYSLPNVIDKVDSFRNTERKKEMLFWTLEEFSRFIACVKQEELYAYFNTLYYTGMRKGEAQALLWSDVDLGNGTININKSITRKTEHGSYAVTSPKNDSSNRKITINKKLIEILKNHKSPTVNKDSFVFGGAAPLSNTTIDRYLSFYSNEANVKKIRQHDFRHSHASFLIANGISIVAVSKRLGHSTVSQTLDTYSHLMPAEEQKILDVLDK